MMDALNMLNKLYDVIYFYIFPSLFSTKRTVGLPEGGLGYGVYIIQAGLLPVAIYFMRQKKPQVVKYIYFIAYTSINIINELLIYWGSEEVYATGNIFEIFLVLLSPIFVNRPFYFLVLIGTIIKYIIMGITLHTMKVMVPILLVIVFALISFIVLNRFQGYVKAIKRSFDQQLESIVRSIITTLELKDTYTRGHSERVALYSTILAKEVGSFSQEELRSFYYACLLHDIGKINIPDSILSKPAKLTNEEYDIIKLHPVVGAQAIQEIEGLSDSIDVTKYHHERWDGKGYPEGLARESIPFKARITAIADAFDAMTSSRSYRAALSAEEAYDRVVQGAGTQFDPELVEHFKKVFPSWVELINNEEVGSPLKRLMP